MSNAELIRNLQEAMQSRSRPAPYDATAVVTRVDGTTAWVRLAGSDTETPVKLTIDAKAGDTVQVRVGGGSAWLTGNQSAPPTDDTTAIISKLLAQEADTKAVTAGKTADEAKEEIKAVAADLVVARELIAQKATIEDLNAEKARIDTLDANKANVADLNAATGRIGQLEANALTADSATIKDLQANKANVSDLTAATGRIGQLEADHVSTADLEAVQADIDNLEATKADVAVLEADYAKIDLANVNTAQITNGVIQTAAIVDEQVFTVTGNKATIKEINADNINVRNLNAKNLKIETADGYIMLGDKKTPTKEFIDSLTNDLNDRIDGAFETFTATAVPTLSNYPANQWKTAEERATHVGDVCYVVNDQIAQNGYCYRFTLNGSTFSWQLIKDSDVTAALARLTTAEGKIGNIEAFDEDIATFKTETEGEISTLQTRTTTLETSLGDKVDKTTFNEVSQKVDENSASITTLETNVAKKADSSTVTTLSNTVNSVSQKADSNEAAISDLTEVVESKADGSTVSTLTQTVNSVKQTADGNSSTITSLTTTLGTNADGTTKAGDIVHRTSAVEQDLSGFKTTVAQTYHKTSDFNTYKTANDSAVAAAKKAGDDAQADLDAYKGTVSETYATKSSVTQTADGIKQEVASTYTTQTEAQGYASTAESNAKADTTNKLKSYSTTSQMNTAISQSASTIEAKITASETSSKEYADGLISTEVTNRNAAITAASDSITASVAETYTTKTDFNALEIGGRNLFKNSKWGTPWVFDTGASRYDADTVQIVAGSSGMRRVYQLPSQGYWGRWEANTTYTLSVDAKASTNGLKLSMQPQADGVPYKYIDVTTEWKRYSYTFTSGNAVWTASCTLLLNGTSGTLYLRKPKLEYGNKATDWTPAPEDLEAYADSAVATAKSEIKVTTDGISTEVAKKVGSSEIISKINQSAETVKIQASKVEVDGTVIIGKSTAESVAKTAVDGLQVGGRNLAKDTNVSFTWTSADGNTHLGGRFCGNLLSGTVITVSAQIDAENVTWPASGARRIGCETSIAKTGGGRQYIGVWAGQQVSDGANVVKAFTGSFHGRVSKTFTLAGDWKASDNTPIICYAQNFYGTVSVSNIKIEIGSKATDWSPAPEDVDAGIASASQTASKYITADSTSGIKVHAEANPTTNYAQIDDTGMSIYQGVDGVATEVASFKASGARIGKSGQTNIQIASDEMAMSGPDGQAALIASYERVTDEQGNVKYGTEFTRDDSPCYVSMSPSTTPNELGQYPMAYSAYMKNFVWQIIAGWYMQFDDQMFSVYSPNNGGFRLALRTGLFTSDKGFATNNGYTDIVEYEDVTVSISYKAGTIGTRGASESLGTTVKANHTYIGAYIVDNRNTSAFNATVQGKGPNNTAHLCAYRATGNAVSDASVTVRKIWLKTGTEV